MILWTCRLRLLVTGFLARDLVLNWDSLLRFEAEGTHALARFKVAPRIPEAL